jgi:hypothetical protein
MTMTIRATGESFSLDSAIFKMIERIPFFLSQFHSLRSFISKNLVSDRAISSADSAMAIGSDIV